MLPDALVEPILDLKWVADWATAFPVQEALLDFLASGEYERHLRRARTLYGKRREAFVAGLDAILGERARFRDTCTALHLLVALPGVPASETRRLILRAFERGSGIYPSAAHDLEPPAHAELIMGFTRVDERQIEERLGRLAEVIDELVGAGDR